MQEDDPQSRVFVCNPFIGSVSRDSGTFGGSSRLLAWRFSMRCAAVEAIPFVVSSKAPRRRSCKSVRSETSDYAWDLEPALHRRTFRKTNNGTHKTLLGDVVE